MATNTADRLSLEVTHIFNAPRKLVFKAWSRAEHCAQWFGPRDFTVPCCEVEFRVGGTYRANIRSPEGVDYWFNGVYREIIEPERLVFTFKWEEDGERGKDTLVIVTFVEQKGKTKMTFQQAPFESLGELDGHTRGWSECFQRLAQYLEKI
jgi:uncharacterized protein YndB with AHSA1/START domain